MNKLISSVEKVDNWISKIDYKDFDFDEIKNLEVNKEIVAIYEGKNEKNGRTM